MRTIGLARKVEMEAHPECAACPQGADWAQLQNSLFPRAYNLHMAFCDGLQNRKGLISPASHRGFHSAVCIVHVTFPRKRRKNRHVEVEVEVEVDVWVEVGSFGLKFKLNFKLQLKFSATAILADKKIDVKFSRRNTTR